MEIESKSDPTSQPSGPEGAAAAVQEHGKLRGYNRGCRCDECRDAVTTYRRKLRKQAKERAASGRAKFKHGYSGYRDWGCRCETCQAAHAAKNAQYRQDREEREPGSVTRWNAEWREAQDPERLKAVDLQSKLQHRAKTRAKANRHGFQWTGPELEVAARSDLTIAEVALMLGRTYDAVCNARRRLKDDPKLIHLAGLPRAADDSA